MLFGLPMRPFALTGGAPISITADYFFQAASTIFLTLVIGFVIVRVVEPRLDKYDRRRRATPPDAAADEIDPRSRRGCAGRDRLPGHCWPFAARHALPPGAAALTRQPARSRPDALRGAACSLSSCSASLSRHRLCRRSANLQRGQRRDRALVVKDGFAGLGGLIFMLLMISQFIAYISTPTLPSFIATVLAGWLGQAGIPAIPLLIGFWSWSSCCSTSSFPGSPNGDLRTHLRAALHPAGLAQTVPPTAPATRPSTRSRR